MPGGRGNIKPEDGKQFSKEYQPDEIWTEKKAIKLGNELIEWMNEVDENQKDKGNIFWEEFLVIVKDYYPGLSSYLAKKYSSFFKLLEKAKKTQELKLVKYGVQDQLQATMTKFVLINHHDYIDRVEQKHSGEIGNNNSVTLTDDQLNQVLATLTPKDEE